MRRGRMPAAVLMFAISLAAQTPTASVVGRITDPTGAVVPGVSVKLTNLDTNVSH